MNKAQRRKPTKGPQRPDQLDVEYLRAQIEELDEGLSGLTTRVAGCESQLTTTGDARGVSLRTTVGRLSAEVRGLLDVVRIVELHSRELRMLADSVFAERRRKS